MRLLTVVCLLLALPTPADALGTKVWIDCRHSGPACNELALIQPLIDSLTVAGATEVIPDTSIGESVADGDFRLLIMIRPQLALTTPERTWYLPGFLSNGGRLVLLADYEDALEPIYNEYMREILDSRPGNPLVLDAEDHPGGCFTPPITGAGILPDTLTDGLSTWHYAHTNSVSGGTPLLQFNSGIDGLPRTLAAKWRDPNGGEIVLIGDTEGFTFNCIEQAPVWTADHDAFWQNLYLDQSQLAGVDGDGDGFESDEDCNDDNAAVNPGMTEECNKLDDNCDGQTDEGCGDDDDSTADPGDDDTTPDPGDDDDSTSGVDLGDDDTGGGSSWGDDCGCAQGTTGGFTAGAAAALLAFRRRSARRA